MNRKLSFVIFCENHDILFVSFIYNYYINFQSICNDNMYVFRNNICAVKLRAICEHILSDNNYAGTNHRNNVDISK